MRVISWAVFIAGFLCLKLVAAANATRGLAAQDVWWIVSPVVATLTDAVTLFVALRLARRFPLGRSQPIRHLGVYLLPAPIYAAAGLAIARWLEFPSTATADPWFAQAAWELLDYALLVGLAHGVEYVRRFRASDAAALRLRMEVADVARRRAEAELRALKMELNPQFLGSALGTVSLLVRSDPTAAERVLAELGAGMRETLSRASLQEVTLAEEIETLSPFLAVQRARPEDQLAITWDLDDSAREAYVPRLILQPLLERVVNGGQGKRHAAAVRISATSMHEGSSTRRLRLEISSTEVDSTSSASTVNAGDETFSRIRSRLNELYGAQATLALDTTEVSGTTARLILPWRGDDAETASREGKAPENHAAKARRAPALPLVICFIALFTLVFTRSYDRPLPGGAHGTFVGAIVDGFFGATLTTAMLFAAITLTISRRPSSWRAHGITAVSFGLVNLAGKVIIISLIGEPYRMIPPGRMVGAVVSGAVIYGVLAAFVHAGEFARRFRGSEAAALRLRADLAEFGRQRVEAELRALKAELNPHFLGNALATVSSFVRTDPAAAERVLTQLADVLRAAIARVGTQEVTLGEEIDGLASFLAVERARFGDKIAFSWDVDDSVRNARVPHLILQPLVENAIKHGLAARGAGHIVVAGRRAGKRLELSVRDDGVGVRSAESAPKRGTGVGLANARARLEELYGDDASLDLVSGSGAGTEVRLTLPWRDKPDAAGVGAPALSHYAPTA